MRPLALTMGDPSGIGPDITLKAWQHHQRTKQSAPLPPFLVVGDIDMLAERVVLLGLNVQLQPVGIDDDVAEIFDHAVPVWPIKLSGPVTVGTPNVVHGLAIVQSIAHAVELTAAGHTRAVVTNPISKASLYQSNFRHPGHTEYLGELAKLYWPNNASQPVMMLAAHNLLRVVPLTIHIPLSRVPHEITPERIEQVVETTNLALMKDFTIAEPRIAVTGLNPHAGENGTMGREELDVIIPALHRLASRGVRVTGPHPADTLFHAEARAHYDVVIAMYHDQALVPLKTLAFDHGVNITLGLPFVRTSPDHGTAFSIAGTGQANARSLVESIKLASDMSVRREASKAK